MILKFLLLMGFLLPLNLFASSEHLDWTPNKITVENFKKFKSDPTTENALILLDFPINQDQALHRLNEALREWEHYLTMNLSMNRIAEAVGEDPWKLLKLAEFRMRELSRSEWLRLATENRKKQEEIKNKRNEKALVEALNEANEKEVIRLLDQHAPINKCALVLALSRGLNTIATLLIGAGADATRRVSDELTPLLIALNNNDLPMMEMLFIHGADINERYILEYTLLHRAMHPRVSADIQRFLIENGASLVAVSSDGFSILDLALKNKISEDIIFLIFNRGGRLHSSDQSTNLHLAVESENFDTIRQLVGQEHADVNAYSTHGIRPLHIAARRGNLEITRYLIEKGAQPNIQDACSLNALRHSWFSSNESLISYLLERTQIMDYDLSAAVYGDHLVAVRLLVQRGLRFNRNGQSALYFAASYRRYEIARYLLSIGMDPLAQDQFGLTPLSIAENDPHMIEILQRPVNYRRLRYGIAIALSTISWWTTKKY